MHYHLISTDDGPEAGAATLSFRTRDEALRAWSVNSPDASLLAITDDTRDGDCTFWQCPMDTKPALDEDTRGLLDSWDELTAALEARGFVITMQPPERVGRAEPEDFTGLPHPIEDTQAPLRQALYACYDQVQRALDEKNLVERAQKILETICPPQPAPDRRDAAPRDWRREFRRALGLPEDEDRFDLTDAGALYLAGRGEGS